MIETKNPYAKIYSKFVHGVHEDNVLITDDKFVLNFFFFFFTLMLVIHLFLLVRICVHF
jgi:hypothetical protein